MSRDLTPLRPPPAANRRPVLLGALAVAVIIFSLGYTLGGLGAPGPTYLAPPSVLLARPADLRLPSHAVDATIRGRHSSGRGPPDGASAADRSSSATSVAIPAAAAEDHFRFRTLCGAALPREEIVPTLLDRLFNGTSPYAGFPPRHAAGLLRRERRRGWGSTAPVFKSLVESVRPRTIVEVGTFLGASALHMANLTADLGTLILCLDDFRGWPGFRRPAPPTKDPFGDMADVNGDVVLMYQFMQNVVAAGEEGRVLPVPFSTASALTALCEWGVYADLVEVDAGHDFHSAWQDINMGWAVVRPGGVMFGHDYTAAADNRGVRRAVDLFARTRGLRVQSTGQHWVLHPPKTR